MEEGLQEALGGHVPCLLLVLVDDSPLDVIAFELPSDGKDVFVRFEVSVFLSDLFEV
jgi:hypothetical protein